MKHILKSLFFLTIILTFAGCKKEIYPLKEAFTVKFNKSSLVNIDGKDKIKFTKLEEDSRCQPDVYCSWAGQVAVKITIDNEKEIILGHHTSIPSTAEFKNHTIQLLEVTYDKKKNFGKEKHSTIKLSVD